MAKSKSKSKANVRRAARQAVADQRFHGRCITAVRSMTKGAANLFPMSSPRRSARIGARVRPLTKGRLTSLAHVTGKTEAEILELAIARLRASDIIGQSWTWKVFFWRR